jgi:hypothetical protein
MTVPRIAQEAQKISGNAIQFRDYFERTAFRIETAKCEMESLGNEEKRTLASCFGKI